MNLNLNFILGSTAATNSTINKSKNWNKSGSLFMSQISQFLMEEPLVEGNLLRGIENYSGADRSVVQGSKESL